MGFAIARPILSEDAMRHNDPIPFIGSATTRREDRKACIGSRNGVLFATFIFAVAAFLLPTIASADSTHRNRPSDRSWHDYGFLPGYEPPEIIEWRRARARRPTFWYGGPGFYRGRWNGGGFGPCWTQTPIGPHWNCG